jgi:hypothetical protein
MPMSVLSESCRRVRHILSFMHIKLHRTFRELLGWMRAFWNDDGFILSSGNRLMNRSKVSQKINNKSLFGFS